MIHRKFEGTVLIKEGMQAWMVAMVAGALASGLLLLGIAILWKYAALCFATDQNSAMQRESEGSRTRLYGELQHTGSESGSDYALKTANQSPSVWRNASFMKPFKWADHPALMADALERGWTAFAFSFSAPPSHGASPKLWNAQFKGSYETILVPEIRWEVGPATELMQVIRFNPTLTFKDGLWRSIQILHSALPLPGPAFGAGSFPQEAYFEIIIIAEGDPHPSLSCENTAEHEEVNLIPKLSPLFLHTAASGGTEAAAMAASILAGGSGGEVKTESGRLLKLKTLIENRGGRSQHFGKKLQLNMDEPKKSEVHAMAIGLTVESPPPLSFPGSYFGSVGFHSNTQMFQNGYLYNDKSGSSHSMRKPWAAVNNTLGCGFNPCSKKVFFTLNGEHMGEMLCSMNEFEHPLYVSIGSNYDATVMVNFGQGPFVYIPANGQRISAPGNHHTPSRSLKAGLNYDDSGEFFSMGMQADHSQSLVESENSNSQEFQHHHRTFSEAESEFFEIVLDGRNLQ